MLSGGRDQPQPSHVAGGEKQTLYCAIDDNRHRGGLDARAKKRPTGGVLLGPLVFLCYDVFARATGTDYAETHHNLAVIYSAHREER